jgi:hypothetical protein
VVILVSFFSHACALRLGPPVPRRHAAGGVSPPPTNREGGGGVGGGSRMGHSDRPNAMHATKEGAGGVGGLTYGYSNWLSKFRNRARVGLCTCRSAYAESLKLSGDRYVCLRCLTLSPCRKPLLYVSERVSETQPSAPFLTRHPSASETPNLSNFRGTDTPVRDE